LVDIGYYETLDDFLSELRKAEMVVTDARIAYDKVSKPDAKIFEEEYLHDNPQHDK